jgi:hypothetical protein
MKVLKSTGNPEQDAKLLNEALGITNQESLEDAKKKSELSNSGKASGNALVSGTHTEGEVLAVIRDGKEDAPKGNAAQEPARKVPELKQVNEGLAFQDEAK